MNALHAKNSARRRHALIFASVALTLTLTLRPAAAQQEGGGVAVETSFAKLAEDYFLVPRLEAAYVWNVAAIACEDDEDDCETSLRLAGQLPIRLRVSDRQPTQSSLIREADWDEVADWFRIVRRAEYGRPTEPLHIEFGPLGPASVGHGTIVHDYYNVVSVDHFHPGTTASLNTTYGGIEMLIDDVTAPRLVATRLFVRPAAFFDDESWAERIAIGGTFATDIFAPTELATTSDGDLVVTDTRSPDVTESTTTAFAGVDAEVTVFDGEVCSFVPFVDFNAHLGIGTGFHAGGFLNFEKGTVTAELRGEYRQTSRRYIPGYFGPLYQVDRFRYSGWGLSLPAPKVRAAASIPARTRRGGAGSLSVDVEGITSVEVSYADHGPGDNEQLRLRAVATPHERVQLGAFYFNQNFGGLSDALSLDGALLASEARVDVYAPLYVFGGYGRSWQLDASDGYVTVDDWEVGIGASWRL